MVDQMNRQCPLRQLHFGFRELFFFLCTQTQKMCVISSQPHRNLLSPEDVSLAGARVGAENTCGFSPSEPRPPTLARADWPGSSGSFHFRLPPLLQPLPKAGGRPSNVFLFLVCYTVFKTCESKIEMILVSRNKL